MKDAGEFAGVYEREAQMVLVFVARRTLDGQVALDITAETFAQAFRGRRSFRGTTEAEQRAWLLTIARRQMGRYLRRGVVEQRAVQRLQAHVPVAHEDDGRCGIGSPPAVHRMSLRA
jgi:DNA-directed RNA polymerase specialized sigma24 family protein